MWYKSYEFISTSTSDDQAVNISTTKVLWDKISRYECKNDLIEVPYTGLVALDGELWQ